jgi:hypothetical protein
MLSTQGRVAHPGQFADASGNLDPNWADDPFWYFVSSLRCPYHQQAQA